jgi:hypothetical protein
MGRRKSTTVKEPKRKAVKVRLAPRMHAGQVTEPYRIMEAIIASDREDLADVKIGLAWHTGWRPDADGVRTHGKCVKRTDLDRSLDSYDVMILLNEQSWKAFDETSKQRLLFHELEHAQIARDKNGQPLIDDKGRVVIRMKRHDVADFADVIERFGLPPCLQDVDIADSDRPLLKLAEQKAENADEWTYVVDADGFVTNPTEEPIIVPDFLKAEVKLLFACIDDIWYYGYEIKGRVGRSRRVRTLLTDGWAELAACLHDLSTTIKEDLKADRSRLAEFLVYKIDAAAQAVERRATTLAEAMAQEVRLPADFAEGSTTEGTETTENSTAEVVENAGGKTITLEPKLAGLKNCSVLVRMGFDVDLRWHAGYCVTLGNRETTVGRHEGPSGATQADCLREVSEAVAEWAVNLTMQEKSEISRRERFLKQWGKVRWGKLLRAADQTGHESQDTSDDGKDAKDIPFEEDPPRGE